MTAPKVDVLAVMERLEDYYRRHEVLIGPVDDAYSVEHKAARLAMAELIEADKEYDDAMRGEADTDGMLRRESARARRKAALTRIGGAK